MLSPETGLIEARVRPQHVFQVLRNGARVCDGSLVKSNGRKMFGWGVSVEDLACFRALMICEECLLLSGFCHASHYRFACRYQFARYSLVLSSEVSQGPGARLESAGSRNIPRGAETRRSLSFKQWGGVRKSSHLGDCCVAELTQRDAARLAAWRISVWQLIVKPLSYFALITKDVEAPKEKTLAVAVTATCDHVNKHRA